MDSLSTKINNLRNSLMAAMAELEAVEAAVSAIPTASTVPVAAVVPVAVAAALPMPPPIQRQQALGVATPAAFGCAKANADYYLAGKGLYSGVLARRYQEYYDGAWAAAGYTKHFIYRFFVFEEIVSGPFTGTQAAHWKPIGLLNPHAYNTYKASGARGKTFLDFVDASQPAPDVTAYWRREQVQAPMGGGGGGPSEAVYTTKANPWSDIFLGLPPAARRAHSAAAANLPPPHPPTLSRQNAVADLTTPVGEAAPAVEPPRRRCAATPAGFACCMATCSCRPSNTLDPRAESLAEELDELEEEELEAEEGVLAYDQQLRLGRLRDHWLGRWATLPGGKRVIIYHFHAFEPPADGSYRKAQPLKHLGFYNFHDRTISETTSCPVLPGNASWRF